MRGTYLALIAKIDAFEPRIAAAQGQFLQCRPGCDGCCRTRRTAWRIEIDHIADFAAVQSDAWWTRVGQRRHHPDVVGGHRCPFLDDEGCCDVYAARPVICRTHGPAARRGMVDLVWCTLSFDGMSAEAVVDAVNTDGIIDLNHIETLLALINRQYVGDDEFAGERWPLDTALDIHGTP